jgi:hypothetical protein
VVGALDKLCCLCVDVLFIFTYLHGIRCGGLILCMHWRADLCGLFDGIIVVVTGMLEHGVQMRESGPSVGRLVGIFWYESDLGPVGSVRHD